MWRTPWLDPKLRCYWTLQNHVLSLDTHKSESQVSYMVVIAVFARGAFQVACRSSPMAGSVGLKEGQRAPLTACS